MRKLLSACAVGALAILLLSSCSPITQEQNDEALAVIEPLAARDSKVDNQTGEVQCDDPKDTMLTDQGYPSVFRTVCRVFFVDSEGANRHKDMWCIGDLEKTPMAEKCYVWLPYYPEGVKP